VGRRQVLELVHQEVPAPSLGGLSHRRVPEQEADGVLDLGVEIDRPGPGQGVAVAGQDLGEPHRIRELRLHRGRVAEADADGAQGLEVRGEGVGVALVAHLDEPVEDPAAVRLVEHRRPSL